jgi:3-mercaptopyruvate sulfurtransferase SseA
MSYAKDVLVETDWVAELLGRDKVKNYDGSWTEWGNLVGVPVEKDV